MSWCQKYMYYTQPHCIGNKEKNNPVELWRKYTSLHVYTKLLILIHSKSSNEMVLTMYI